MVTTGLWLAALSGAAFYLIYSKMPRRVKRFMRKHVLLTDAAACLLTYMLFGTSLVALFAAAWMGLIVSVMLALLNNPSTAAMLDKWANTVGQIKDSFIKWAERSYPCSPKEENNEENKPARLKVI